MAEFNINSDGVGKEKLSESLKKVLISANYYTLPQPNLPEQTDVYPIKSN